MVPAPPDASDARVLGALVARERRCDAPALRVPATDYDYGRLCTRAWKAGNLLRHHGVRAGATVAVDAGRGPRPVAVLALLGSALLGASVRFDPPSNVSSAVLVAPTDRLADYDVGPETRQIGYGDAPDDPAVTHFERDAWSENPTAPPETVAPDDPLLATAGTTYAHRDVLAAAREVADRWDLAAGESVALRAPLSHPGAVAAGVVAPLSVGAIVVLPDGDVTADYAVAGCDAPEPSISPDAVL